VNAQVVRGTPAKDNNMQETRSKLILLGEKNDVIG